MECARRSFPPLSLMLRIAPIIRIAPHGMAGANCDLANTRKLLAIGREVNGEDFLAHGSNLHGKRDLSNGFSNSLQISDEMPHLARRLFLGVDVAPPLPKLRHGARALAIWHA